MAELERVRAALEQFVGFRVSTIAQAAWGDRRRSGGLPTRLAEPFEAVVAVPLVLGSTVLGVTDNIDKHRRIAKLTMPLFLFVAAAGAGLTVFLHFLCAAS